MHKLLEFFYPSHCQLCQVPTQPGGHLVGLLCETCATDITINHNACICCALPFGRDHQHSSTNCAECIKSPPVYDHCWSPFIYAQPLEWMIQQLKFNAKLNLVPLLSNLIADNLPVYLDKKPDVIIPMPLHNKRLKQRGFNQSQLLISPIASKLGIPIDIHSAKRIRDTPHQTGKTAHQRQQNIKNAFSYTHKQNYQHVIIFDDVVTTGSSVSELTKTLKQAGVHRVDIWCLARAEKVN